MRPGGRRLEGRRPGGRAARRTAARQGAARRLRLGEMTPIDATVSRADFRNAQHIDPSLARFIDKADVDFPEHSRNVLANWFVVEDGLLYRMVKINDQHEPISQLMVPTSLRLKVLKLGHETAFAGHLGVKKTFDRIVSNFYWPGIITLEQIFYPGVRSSSLIFFVIFYAQYNIIYCLGLY